MVDLRLHQAPMIADIHSVVVRSMLTL
jgi:hypothetical protein